jgi:autoinducer 2-degrading protein
MIVTHVHIHVKPEYLEEFILASTENASHSVQEAGIARFDFVQQADDPTKFLLVEVYRDGDAPAKHKATAHYAKWRDAVAEMMQEPRFAIHYHNLFPDDSGW